MKPNEFWKSIPLVRWILYDKKLNKMAQLKDEATELDSKKSEKEERMRKINDIFLNVQSFLIPSLQSYLSSFKSLQDTLL